MRKFLISAALAASTVLAAAPAAAQWAPPQGYGQGYHGGYGQVRRLQVRIDQLQRQIARLDRRNILSEREAARLHNESRNLEYRLRRAAQYGLDGRERFAIERGIQRLEIRIQREARDGNRYRGQGYGDHYGYGDRDGRAGWGDRDRDGFDDRYERDHGRDYDEDRDPD